MSISLLATFWSAFAKASEALAPFRIINEAAQEVFAQVGKLFRLPVQLLLFKLVGPRCFLHLVVGRHTALCVGDHVINGLTAA